MKTDFFEFDGQIESIDAQGNVTFNGDMMAISASAFTVKNLNKVGISCSTCPHIRSNASLVWCAEIGHAIPAKKKKKHFCSNHPELQK